MKEKETLNLKRALEQGKLDEFAAEHEIEDPRPDGEWRFWKLLELMSGSSASSETSHEEPSEGSDETQTRRDT
jgi:hypothetical protein